MVPWPCWADGAGPQAAPSVAQDPAPLAAPEATVQAQPDPAWPWLWSPAGLGKYARASGPGLAVAPRAGVWAASLV